MRAESGFKDHQAPLVRQGPFVATHPTRDEVQKYCAEKVWDANDARVVKRVKRHLVKGQEEAWRIATQNATVSTEPLPKKRFLTPGK
jgi:hypothetical protein